MIKALGLWSPVIVPFIISGILLFSSERQNKPKLYLVGYMWLITFIFLANLFYFEHNYNVYSWLHSLHIATVLAIYPGAYIYIKLLVEPNYPLRKLIPHFMPSLFFLLASGLIFYPVLNMQERELFLTQYRYHPDFEYPALRILYYVRISNILFLFIQVLYYPFITYFTLKNHRKRLTDLFSNPEKFQLNWLGIFNGLLALSALISVFIYTVNPVKLFGDDRYLAYPLLTVAIMLWYLGIMGNNQAQLPVPGDDQTPEDPVKDMVPEDANTLKSKLITYFDEQNPFLNPELKIWDVARELGTNRTYISQTINQEFDQNFSSFVNSYRIKEARKLIDSHPDLSLSDVAVQTGFGSVLTLSRTFEEMYQVKLSDYKKALVSV
ncbi:helix-turn-helix domain-containing protein [Saccharicrinis sp. FJH54]|uniref:AraC family transcriptional regulator n=1 Tax=Saccharicrinis sp. FJH54 TaxID=3344665 RepID=UPI0035D4A8B1